MKRRRHLDEIEIDQVVEAAGEHDGAITRKGDAAHAAVALHRAERAARCDVEDVDGLLPAHREEALGLREGDAAGRARAFEEEHGLPRLLLEDERRLGRKQGVLKGCSRGAQGVLGEQRAARRSIRGPGTLAAAREEAPSGGESTSSMP